MRTLLHSVILPATLLFAVSAHAVEDTKHADNKYTITIKDKAFSPAKLTVPAGQKITLTVKNTDSAAAEFESEDFDREKVVGANSTATVVIGPLKAGSYTYLNDFHRESTGTIVAE